MLDLIYQFIFNPKKTIQLNSHIKDWRVWWVIIGVSSVLSVIQLSSLTIFSMIVHVILIVSFIVFSAIILDAIAQLLGAKSQLKSVLYWVPFSNIILWVMPSILIIQQKLPLLGVLLAFCLNIIFARFIWVTLSEVYGFNRWRMIGLFTIPFIVVFIIAFVSFIYLFQIAMRVS